MCEMCSRSYCDVTCPSYDGTELTVGSPMGECAVCGAYLYRNFDALARGEVTVCADCTEDVDLDTVLTLTGCEDASTLLCELGFQRRTL